MYLRLLPVLILMTGCLSARPITKPRVTFNGKTKNGWIDNRTPPPYGDGLDGGCIVLSELDVQLQVTGNILTGQIRDVANEKPVPFTQIKITGDLGKPGISTTDSSGRFEILLNGEINELYLLALGYRTLRILPRF